MENRTEGAKKRTGLVVALVLCIALAAAGGVMAWYSSQSSITNTFKTGDINPPTTDPTNPDKPLKPEVDPDPEHNGHKGQVSGNIVENMWIPGSVIVAGSEVAKNPNVGIAPGSDDAYVFVYVNNKLGTGTSFTIEQNWKAVDGYATAGTGANVYTGGLFMYTTDGTNPTLLDAQDEGGKDVYTGELFKTVKAAPDAVIKKEPEMIVSCYMMAKTNAAEDFGATNALEEAKAWAGTQK